MKPYFLCDDLSDLIDAFEANSHRTPAQEREYPKKPKGKRITHDMLGKEHPKYNPNPLRLLEEDGWDGQPVGSLSPKSARYYWDLNTTHMFMPTRDIIRFGIFMHLNIYHTLALVLKVQWEDFFAHEMGWRTNSGKRIGSILRDEAEAKKAKNNFNPDTAVIFNLFEEHKKMASQAGYDSKEFDTLVQEMLLNNLHLVANKSPELQAFIDRTVEQRELLKEGTLEQQERFWIDKCACLELNEQLGDWLMMLSDRKLENANINQRWLAIFGDAEIELTEQRYRKHSLERRLLLKEAEPELSREELDENFAEEEEERRKKLEKLKVDAFLGKIIFVPPINGGVPIEDPEAYRRECKRVLRELWRLLHPDKLEQNSAYAKLTEEQKKFLDNLGKQILAIKPSELGHPETFWESKHRSLESLQDALAKVKAILEAAGLDVDVGLIPRGESLVEQLEWYEKSIERLEREIDSIKAELKALAEDEDIRRKQSILAQPELHEKVKANLLERADKYREEADKLEAELASLFGGDV